MSSKIGLRFRNRRVAYRTSLVALLASGIVFSSLVETTTGASAATKTTLTVMIDATRLPQVKAYEKAHPDVKVDVIIYNGNDNEGELESKIALDNRVGSGWPDVVFDGVTDDPASIADSQFHYPAVLNTGTVSKSVLAGYLAGTNSNCTINGKVYCLRNDIGQNVLWYDSALMTQFGYKVPTTWQQWQKIGEEVATQHPGYIVGTLGESAEAEVYLQASECATNDVIGVDKVLINLNSGDCTRAANLLDPLIKDGSVTTETAFGSTFEKTYKDKILMTIGPSWYGAYLFPGLVPKGDLGVADPLSWAGSSKTYTGDVGGGEWMMSSHVTGKTKTAAAAMITWLATSYGSQGIAPTYPAYSTDQSRWVVNQQKSGMYSNQLAPVFSLAAKEIWTGWSPVPWGMDTIWSSTVTPALLSGSSLLSELSPYQTQLTDYAQSDGYTVVSKSK